MSQLGRVVLVVDSNRLAGLQVLKSVLDNCFLFRLLVLAHHSAEKNYVLKVFHRAQLALTLVAHRNFVPVIQVL